MARSTKAKSSDSYLVHGRVSHSESGQPAAGMQVTAMDADLMFDDKLGTATTDRDGRFRITYGVEQFRDLFERAPDIYLLIHASDGRLVTTTKDATIRNAGPDQEIEVQLPADPHAAKPTIPVGGVPVDRRVLEVLKPEDVLAIAEHAIHGRGDGKVAATLEQLNPLLSLERMRAELSFTPLFRFLRDIARVKNWPRDFRLRIEDILIGYDPDASYATYDCPHFSIGYNDSGTDQPTAGDGGGNITMPGTGAVVGSTIGGNGVPDYIEKLCFWLENALATYTNPPFSLRDPSAGGKIPVSVTGTAPGGAGGGAMTIGRNLNDDLLAAVPTHELMHLIQELYETAGTAGIWNNGMVEGGAVLGEDVVFDTHNRYIVQATTAGTLASPNVSLTDSGARYYLALFLKYITEQQSSRVNALDEPAIGVETYRALLEQCDIDGYTSTAFETAIANLPWYQSFFRFGYLDAARLDETSSETLLGNFWLACYLKDLGTAVPDRRFDFMEDEEDATWDTIFTGMNTVTTLGAVSLTSTNTLNAGGNITLSSGGGGSINPFAARFYKVNVAGGLDTLRVNFTAGAAFTTPIVQIALIEPGNVVRDILRSDRTTWARTIANARGGTNLDHILIVVAGTDVGGTFTLTVQDVAAAPDVSVTRWHHVAGTHYEIDSFGWAWTWVSPDIWVDNDGDGLADSVVFFDENNQLFIRLRNQGHAAASGIGVQFWYQDASGGLSDAGWQPVTDDMGAVQSLSGLNLVAGATDQWSVNWAPAPSGASHHFCIRAVVTVPGDPNTDNKRVLSNFGNVQPDTPYFDIVLLRRFPLWFDTSRIEIIPRTHGQWFISNSDLLDAQNRTVRGGAEIMDTFRVRHRAKFRLQPGRTDTLPEPEDKIPCPCTHKGTRRETRPDPFGHYPTDPRALPPGLGNVPLITIAHAVDGKVQGGFTWAIGKGKK